MKKEFRVVWSRTAQYDLESIIDYIAEDSPLNARRTMVRIRKKCSALYAYPSRGRIVPELKEFNILHYREIIVDPWRIIYKIIDSKVIVMSVIDARRNVEDILLDRLIKL